MYVCVCINTHIYRAVRGRIAHHIMNKPMTTLAESESDEEMHEAENVPVLKHANLDWIQPPKEEDKEGVVKLETELDKAVCMYTFIRTKRTKTNRGICMYVCAHVLLCKSERA